MAAVLAAAVAWHGVSRASADPGPAPALEAEEAQDVEGGVGPTVVSIVPGVLVHGAGHFAAGDPVTAQRLLLAEGIGLGLMAIGGVGIWATGGADEAFIPLYSAAWLGAGLFATSWLADVYGSATGGEGLGTTPPPHALVELGLGYRYYRDVQFDLAHIAVAEAHVRPGRFRISPSAWVGVDDRNERFRLEGAFRVLGARLEEDERYDPDSHFDVVAAGTYHDWHDEGFAFLTGEVALEGRYDLAMLSSTMRGAFVEGLVGYGMQAFDYQATDGGLGTDANGMLLLRIGMGLYVGRRGPVRGELRAYYDHRRDTYVAGLGRPLIYGSVLGYFGGEGTMWLSERWGLRAEVLGGGSIVAGLSALVRFGGEP